MVLVSLEANITSTLVNFDFLGHILDKSLRDKLMINPKETPILFTEQPLHNKEGRLKLTEYMFEKYNVPAMFICKSPVLCTFACGRSTAIVIDSGSKLTQATPVHDGYALQKSIIKHEFGGDNLTALLLNWLEKDKEIDILPRYAFKRKLKNQNGQDYFEMHKFDTSKVTQSYAQWSKEEIIREMKEEMLYVSEDPIDERSMEQIRN